MATLSSSEKNSPTVKRRIEADPSIVSADGEARASGAKKPRIRAQSTEKSRLRGKTMKKPAGDDLCTKDEIFDGGEDDLGEVDEEEVAGVEGNEGAVVNLNERRKGVKATKRKDDDECVFLGKPVPMKEARERWPARYADESFRSVNFGSDVHAFGVYDTMNCDLDIDTSKRDSKLDRTSKGGEDNNIIKAKCHFLRARVDGIIYDLYDDAYVKAEEGKDDYIGHIIEFFQSSDNELYFTCQWFFRAEDTVLTHEHISSHDSKRVFLSNAKDDNMLDCIVSKVQIVRVNTNALLAKEMNFPQCDLFYDMSYSVEYSTFSNLPEATKVESEASSSISDNVPLVLSSGISASDSGVLTDDQTSELSLLDLYSGCGAMSTGLCLGANLSGVNLRTCWAVDINEHACESLKLNHPDAEVRNEQADDFLTLIKEWEKLCKEYGVFDEKAQIIDPNESEDEDEHDPSGVPPDEFEVGKIVGICYGKTDNLNKLGLKFKVRWKGYGPEEDTWEPASGLSKCQERIQAFVRRGYIKNILPLPGRVDVICGGPPCQGASGFNRFRNFKNPLQDEKNRQIVVYMDIVDFLRPKYVLMENVVDILKFASAYLGKYALSRLVCMKYQARLGIMAAGRYGLPQCRNRVFLWGARHTQNLPQFPLGMYHMTARGVCPTEFERNVVFNANQETLEKASVLGDAISDLPPVANNEQRDEMAYEKPPQSYFQTCIRLSRAELANPSIIGEEQFRHSKLFDHRPLELNVDDYQRVCHIPKKKGANFRDLPGVKVRPDNVVEWDPNVERVKLPSGKPLVPDYAMTFVKGKSVKPFGRLWWDETVPTVVTRAEPHNQIILHPDQDRVLTIRENARLQGFPDYYQLCGPVKERYIQVGNAVAVPVSRALGYALGLAFQNKSGTQPTFCLPPKFPLHDRSA